ncbi:MAG: hypothetical protein NVS2B12_13680 [Ktedonobacteraceae bacterium]
MCVSKQIHLDEWLVAYIQIFRATFSPWGLHTHLLELRVASDAHVWWGEDELAPRPLLAFITVGRVACSSQYGLSAAS